LGNEFLFFYELDYTFIVFESYYNLIYLVCSNENLSILLYNLDDEKKICEIKNAHKDFIQNFRHYQDKREKRDLVLSTSIDNNIKLWNINIFECIYNYEKVNNKGFLYSACFLNDNNNNYILSCNDGFAFSEPIKVFDFYGNMIKEINDSYDSTNFIDVYYDNKSTNKYIITGNCNYMKSYNYDLNEVYHIYQIYNQKNGNNSYHHNLIIYEDGGIANLIDLFLGKILIWDFHSGELLRNIDNKDNTINSFCLWKNEYIFISCLDNSIKLMEFKTGAIIRDLKNDSNIINLKTITIPKLGDCLISQEILEKIKIWKI
jgi:WD40 repeat protein